MRDKWGRPVESGESWDFFEKSYCDRCRKKLDGRIMSWFTDETICLDCSRKEDLLKREMRKRGMNPSDYEGCGYLPKVK